jgi:hypothetical protein
MAALSPRRTLPAPQLAYVVVRRTCARLVECQLALEDRCLGFLGLPDHDILAVCSHQQDDPGSGPTLPTPTIW